MRTRYRIDDFQECYCVLQDLDELLALARVDFGPVYAQVAGAQTFEPGALQPGDTVLHRGTGAYHRDRRPPHRRRPGWRRLGVRAAHGAGMWQGIGEGARGREQGWRAATAGVRATLGGWLLAAATLAVAAPAAPTAPTAPTPQALTLSRPEGPRRVLLAVPEHAPAGPRPLVILLHGHGGSAAQVLGLARTAAPLSQWLAIGQREGLLVAAPDGLPGGDQKSGWNDCRRDTQTNPTSDDVGLISALIDEAVAHHGADPARVYLMGMSNGGMMALRYAMEAGDRLAGVAAVSASMATDSRCPSIQVPLSVLLVGGTADGIVPWDGGPVGKRHGTRRGRVIGAEATVTRWRERDGLFGEPARSESVPHRDPADPTRAQRTVWGAQPDGLQIELLRIDGGGHVEPSLAHRVSAAYSLLVGRQSGDLEVADEAWALFRDKRRGLSR